MTTGVILTRDELEALTGTVQAKRMAAWLDAKGWVYEAATRRGEAPKVGRSYAEAKLAGLTPQPTPSNRPRRAVEPCADWMLQRARKAA